MKVTTINGEEISKKDARKIKREDGSFGYYKIGNPDIKDSGDCYQINNIFYTIEKKRIVWDYLLKRYVLKTSTFEGVVDSKLNIGSFSNEANVITLYINEVKKLPCMSKDIALELNYIEGSFGIWYNPKYYTYSQIFPRRIVDSNYKNSLQYNFKGYLDSCKKNYAAFKITENSDAEELYALAPHLFDKYSFGIELETTKGLIPDSLYKNLGVMPVRDGSISGLEYVTIPLQGKKGVYAFKQIMEYVIRYTDSNYTCSMHVHVGGVPRTMEFIVAMFKFGYYFQEHLYPIFPGYKRINDGIKRQCYTAPLDSLLMSSLNFKSDTTEKLKEDYQKIVSVLSGHHDLFTKFVDLENIQSHPSDPQENAKWHMKERYKWLNIIPLVFTNKQTTEYRIFTVPDTVDKAFLFLIMSLMMSDFVTRNTQTILAKPSYAKKIDLFNLVEATRVSSVVRHVLQHRHGISGHHTNNKGAFFEESALIMPASASLVGRRLKDEESLEDALQRKREYERAVERHRRAIEGLGNQQQMQALIRTGTIRTNKRVVWEHATIGNASTLNADNIFVTTATNGERI